MRMAKENVSLNLAEEDVEELDRRASDEDNPATGRSAAGRQLFDEWRDQRGRIESLQDEVKELETELEDRDNRIRELRDQLAAVTEQTEDVQELVEVREREQSLQEIRARASAAERLYYWLVGWPLDEES